IHEGFGLEPLEAMKCGVPVITTHMGSLAEVVGENAIIMRNPIDAAELAELVRWILGSEGVAEKFRGKGLAWAARFSSEETVRQTLDVYNQVMSA
ncbi:MAG: glycosyltransferase, partial [Nitrososphaerales archaeon]|nr:glycosyltransferase [Nitrososphaerales archaeon]